ncbi:hypothetical protein ACJJTC_005443 [Scirpophaga incertulas]
MKFSGYKIAASFCREKRTGGGVVIFLQDHIESTEIQDIHDMSMEFGLEACAAYLNNEDILLVTMYWNGRDKKLPLELLNEMLKFINKKYCKSNVIIGGKRSPGARTPNTRLSTPRCKMQMSVLAFDKLKLAHFSFSHIRVSDFLAVKLASGSCNKSFARAARPKSKRIYSVSALAIHRRLHPGGYSKRSRYSRITSVAARPAVQVMKDCQIQFYQIRIEYFFPVLL